MRRLMVFAPVFKIGVDPGVRVYAVKIKLLAKDLSTVTKPPSSVCASIVAPIKEYLLDWSRVKTTL